MSRMILTLIMGSLFVSCIVEPISVDAPTWYADVLPLVQDNCLECHRSGAIAPTDLSSYELAAPAATLIAQEVARKTMPPWLPNEECQPHLGARTLTTPEIDTFAAWAEAGAPMGDPSDAPPPPESFPSLDRIDLEIDAGGDYLPNDQGQTDDYRCFVIDPGLVSDAYLIATDTVPGTPGQVHHVLLYAAPLAEAQAKDDNEAGLGWTCFGGPGVGDGLTLGGWVPGMPVMYYPPDTGIRLIAGEAIVLQVHYNFDNGPATPDRTKVQLKLEETVVNPATMYPLADFSFGIPPNTESYTTTDSVTLPIGGIRLYGNLPHMHQLGSSINVTIHRDGTEICAVDVPQWDFNWQQFFFYEDISGIPLASGDRVEIACTFSNPTNQTVTWGDGTADEMCLNYLYVTGLPNF